MHRPLSHACRLSALVLLSLPSGPLQQPFPVPRLATVTPAVPARQRGSHLHRHRPRRAARPRLQPPRHQGRAARPGPRSTHKGKGKGKGMKKARPGQQVHRHHPARHSRRATTTSASSASTASATRACSSSANCPKSRRRSRITTSIRPSASRSAPRSTAPSTRRPTWIITSSPARRASASSSTARRQHRQPPQPRAETVRLDRPPVRLPAPAPGTDAVLDATLAEDGDYYVRLRQFTYTLGGPEYFYRLTVSTGPWIDAVFPPVVEPGKTSKVTLYGRNLPGGKLDRRGDAGSGLVAPPVEVTAAADGARTARFRWHVPPPAPRWTALIPPEASPRARRIRSRCSSRTRRSCLENPANDTQENRPADPDSVRGRRPHREVARPRLVRLHREEGRRLRLLEGYADRLGSLADSGLLQPPAGRHGPVARRVRQQPRHADERRPVLHAHRLPVHALCGSRRRPVSASRARPHRRRAGRAEPDALPPEYPQGAARFPPGFGGQSRNGRGGCTVPPGWQSRISPWSASAATASGARCC